MMTYRTAADAIARSISHQEIVTIDHDETIANDLLAECEDSVKTNSVVEYWGTDDDGDEWRVHMHTHDPIIVTGEAEGR